MLHHRFSHPPGGVAIRAQHPGDGRPPNGAAGRSVELERTACYACTDWHTCLVFETPVGVRLPLCDACLRLLVPRAIERGAASPAAAPAGAGAARRR
jgi:hypothetical protein